MTLHKTVRTIEEVHFGQVYVDEIGSEQLQGFRSGGYPPSSIGDGDAPYRYDKHLGPRSRTSPTQTSPLYEDIWVDLRQGRRGALACFLGGLGRRIFAARVQYGLNLWVIDVLFGHERDAGILAPDLLSPPVFS